MYLFGIREWPFYRWQMKSRARRSWWDIGHVVPLDDVFILDHQRVEILPHIKKCIPNLNYVDFVCTIFFPVIANLWLHRNDNFPPLVIVFLLSIVIKI